ncbi:hypothetical protein ACS0TY_009611 [Phlomoides rotata]
MAEGDLKKGTVKWFNDQKGFGFITPDDGTEELFVHQSAIKTDGFRSLGDGEAVEYVVEYGNDGRAKAANVTGPDGASVQGSTRGSYGGGGRDGGGGYNGGSRGGDRGYEGGGGDRGYGGGDGNGCFKCGESGHMAMECTQGGGGGGDRYGGGRGGGDRYDGGRGGGEGGGCYGCRGRALCS